MPKIHPFRLSKNLIPRSVVTPVTTKNSSFSRRTGVATLPFLDGLFRCIVDVLLTSLFLHGVLLAGFYGSLQLNMELGRQPLDVYPEETSHYGGCGLIAC